MLLLIDGYNVIAPVAAPGRPRIATRRHGAGRGAGDRPASDWLHAERMRLLERLARQLDPLLASKTHVIFDAAGAVHGRPQAYRIEGIHVRFAVDHAEADDLIEELIAAHHFPKRLTVVSSDHRLQAAARRAGAAAFDSQPWLDALLAGKLMLAIAWPGPHGGKTPPRDLQHAKPDRVGPGEVEHWMRLFAGPAEEAGEKNAGEAGVASELSAPARSAGPRGKPAAEKLAGGKAAGGKAKAGAGSKPPSEQGRGRGRAGKRSADRSAAPPQSGQGRRKRAKKDSPEDEPLPDDYNPFPPGYGEDLLP